VVSGDIKDIVRVGLHKAHKLLVETNKLEEFERLVSGTWSNPKDQIIIMVVLNHHYTDVTLLFESLYTLMKYHTKVIEAPLVAKMDLIGSRTKLKDATMNSCAVFHPYMLNIHHEINKWFAMFHNCIVTRSMEIVNLGDDEIKLTKVIKTYVDLLEEIHQSVSQVIENDMPKALEKIEKALEKIDYGEVSEKYVPGFKLITDISKNSESFITDIKKHAALFENDTHKPNAKIKQRILEATRIQHKTAQLFAQWLGKIRRGVHITYTVSKAHCAMAKAMDAEIRHITRYFTNVIGKDK
jgi:hypothetical protein